jgi:hypothetical protein
MGTYSPELREEEHFNDKWLSLAPVVGMEFLAKFESDIQARDKSLGRMHSVAYWRKLPVSVVDDRDDITRRNEKPCDAVVAIRRTYTDGRWMTTIALARRGQCDRRYLKGVASPEHHFGVNLVVEV